jgi:hypothetical protein
VIERGLGPNVIVDNSNRVRQIDGELRVDPQVVISREQFEEYRLGYRCLRCHGVQSKPMPEVCEVRDLTGTWRCGYRIKDDQLRHLEQETDEQWYGPSPDDYDYEQENWMPKSGIYVPKHYKH